MTPPANTAILRAMRIVTGAFSHESSTFTPVPTDRASYASRFGYLRGASVLDTFRDTNTPIGGFIEGADAHGFELIPTIFAEPHPSAPTGRELFDEILGELLDGIRAAGAIDPSQDSRYSQDYRRHLIKVWVKRCLHEVLG